MERDTMKTRNAFEWRSEWYLGKDLDQHSNSTTAGFKHLKQAKKQAKRENRQDQNQQRSVLMLDLGSQSLSDTLRSQTLVLSNSTALAMLLFKHWLQTVQYCQAVPTHKPALSCSEVLLSSWRPALVEPCERLSQLPPLPAGRQKTSRMLNFNNHYILFYIRKNTQNS